MYTLENEHEALTRAQTAKLERNEKRLRVSLVLLLVLLASAFVVGAYYTYTGLPKLHNAEVLAKVSSDAPIAVNIASTKAFYFPFVILAVAVFPLMISVKNLGVWPSSWAKDWYFFITLIGGALVVVASLAFSFGAVLSLDDPAIKEWAADRYGVELVGDSYVEDGTQVLLENGETVIFTKIETTEGAAYILTHTNSEELPIE